MQALGHGTGQTAVRDERPEPRYADLAAMRVTGERQRHAIGNERKHVGVVRHQQHHPPVFVVNAADVELGAVRSALGCRRAPGLPPEDDVRDLRHPCHLKLTPVDRVAWRDIAETGNTSAASIPLAMSRMLEEGEAPHGGTALQIGFGAGLVYAAQVVLMP